MKKDFNYLRYLNAKTINKVQINLHIFSQILHIRQGVDLSICAGKIHIDL